MKERQPELFEVGKNDPNIELIVGLLRGAETKFRNSWATAREILAAIERRDDESGRRWVRAIAEGSGGRIAGGQQGYKLVEEMTKEEYDHWRNWMKSQADKMTRRILESDRVFFKRQPVETGNGIL